MKTIKWQTFCIVLVLLIAQVSVPTVWAQIPEETPPLIDVEAHPCHRRREGPRNPCKPEGETPHSIREVYKLPSCGGEGTIAIVVANHYPTALEDFNTFSKTFGLPQEHSCDPTQPSNKVFQVVYSTGVQPPNVDPSWSLEAALDIQWAHAMAPKAKIVLVEAPTAFIISSLIPAVDVASNLPNVKQVSMSWAIEEQPAEATLDVHFTTPGVIYIAASGDAGGTPVYPSCSPNVISAGGTKINRDAKNRFIGETGWSGSGGGPSLYEPVPFYQAAIPFVLDKVGTQRGTPDISFNADPNSGAAIYLTPTGWETIGGTSLSAPSLAGILNLAHSINGFSPINTQAELKKIYKQQTKSHRYRDILIGVAGAYSCTLHWDFVTGVGTNIGVKGK